MDSEFSKMLGEAREARDIMGEMLNLIKEVGPLVEEAQAYVTKGEKPPNALHAKIFRSIAEATERAHARLPEEARHPMLENNNRINRVLADAYERDDEMAIALGHAEQMGASYHTILDMVEKMFEMFDGAVKQMEEIVDEGPDLWTP